LIALVSALVACDYVPSIVTGGGPFDFLAGLSVVVLDPRCDPFDSLAGFFLGVLHRLPPFFFGFVFL